MPIRLWRDHDLQHKVAILGLSGEVRSQPVTQMSVKCEWWRLFQPIQLPTREGNGLLCSLELLSGWGMEEPDLGILRGMMVYLAWGRWDGAVSGKTRSHPIPPALLGSECCDPGLLGHPAAGAHLLIHPTGTITDRTRMREVFPWTGEWHDRRHRGAVREQRNNNELINCLPHSKEGRWLMKKHICYVCM